MYLSVKSVIFISGTLLLCFPLISGAQKFIIITPKEWAQGKAEILISEGDRVKCRFTDNSRRVGILDKIGSDSIRINGKPFPVDFVRSIAKRPRGSTALYVITHFVAPIGAMVSFEAGSTPVGMACFAIQMLGWLLLGPMLPHPMRDVKRDWILNVHASKGEP
jgi:hypothetical protein